MTELLTLTEEQRRTVFNQAAFLAGLSPEVVEKDWWVTLTLQAIFKTEYAPHILFKGGTSLSKCWKLINRFSEDIDLALDREFLGFGGNLSNTRIKALKKANSLFTSSELRTVIEEQLIILGVPAGMTTLTAKPVPANSSYPDPQELRLIYPSLYDAIEYIPADVKIEVSGRSLKEPWSTCQINSLVGEHIPGQPFSGQPFQVAAVEPRRTFLEKIFLLHEEFLKTENNIRHFRMSRHLYDVVKLMDTLHGWKAILDTELYEVVRLHREKYYQLPGVEYNTHLTTSVNFIPPATVTDLYRQDYQKMLEQMIRENDPPNFQALITGLEELTQRLRVPADFKGKTIEQIIADAEQLDPKDSTSPNFMIEGGTVTIPLSYNEDGKPMADAKAAHYTVKFVRKDKALTFPKVKPAGNKS
ncbi:MAG: nucleotidyl transferase AbiEii/AbiGii toxin family protein [Chitinophagaceae bacterium]